MPGVYFGQPIDFAALVFGTLVTIRVPLMFKEPIRTQPRQRSYNVRFGSIQPFRYQGSRPEVGLMRSQE
jgi:hypothetical protein